MTDRELMQQALDALELLTDCYDGTEVGVEIESIIALRNRLAQPEPEPFEYWNAVEGWVTVTQNEVINGRARQRMIQTAMRTAQEHYLDDPEAMFAQGWDAGFNVRIKPLTVEELKDKWNAQADQMNHWGTLGHDEMVEFAQAVHCIGGEE